MYRWYFIYYNAFSSGIKALAESVNMVARGNAPKIAQTEEGATYDPALFKAETHQVRFINLYDFLIFLSVV